MAQILVIEDDLEMRETLQTMLERKGYDVLVAANGREGFDVFSKEPTDLIITDILMPEKDGIDVINYFHSNYPEVNIIAIFSLHFCILNTPFQIYPSSFSLHLV